MKHFRTDVSRGDLVDQLYRVVDALNGAVAAVNDCDTTDWNDKEASRRSWIAFDAMEKLTRMMAVRAKLSPVEDYVTLDAIAAAIQQRSDRSDYGEDQDLQATLNRIAKAVGMPSDARETGQAGE